MNESEPMFTGSPARRWIPRPPAPVAAPTRGSFASPRPGGGLGELACLRPRVAGFQFLGFSLSERHTRASAYHVYGYFVVRLRIRRAVFGCNDPHGRPSSAASSRNTPTWARHLTVGCSGKARTLKCSPIAPFYRFLRRATKKISIRGSLMYNAFGQPENPDERR